MINRKAYLSIYLFIYQQCEENILRSALIPLCFLGNSWARHSGHIAWPTSIHWSIHFVWNAWTQFPSTLTWSDGSKFSKQTMHKYFASLSHLFPSHNLWLMLVNSVTGSCSLIVEGGGNCSRTRPWCRRDLLSLRPGRWQRLR